VARRLELRAGTVSRLQRALWAVVNEDHGTGRRARIDGVGVCGKTGTAQAPPSSLPDGDREHAWFAGWAPGDRPLVVAAVFVEHVGHGGEFAAPIARAMIEQALVGRGYLERPSAPAAATGTLVAGGATLGHDRFVGPPALGPGEAGPARAMVGPGGRP
jgi:cell division protein FtsI/penicillin-binding protein 2